MSDSRSIGDAWWSIGEAHGGAAMALRAVARWQSESSGQLVIAIDGHGAAGKTTLAEELAHALGAPVLHTDDYLHPARVSADTRPMAQYYDWERLRGEAILPALAGKPVVSAPPKTAAASTKTASAALGSGSATPETDAPLLIEGVSSACPALADLVTHAIYVDTPEPLRLERLRKRIAPEEWDEDWLEAERVYFASRRPESFDLVVPGAGSGVRS